MILRLKDRSLFDERTVSIINSSDSLLLEGSQQQTQRKLPRTDGFTILELVIVIALFGILFASIGGGLGMFVNFKEQRAIANLAQTMEFLHQEAKSSQEFYQIEFDLEQRAWHVGSLRPELREPIGANVNAATNSNVGIMSLELSDFLNPPLGNSQYFIPPIDFPSLAVLKFLPGEAIFDDIETPRGLIRSDSGVKPYIIFSPRGFTEFAVIHIRKTNLTYVTLVTNPFTGEVEVHPGNKEFRWQLEEAAGL